MQYNNAPAAQAKNCGDVLVVGLIPDSEILRCKGPPVCNEEERKLQVETVKWVDEVITGLSHCNFLKEMCICILQRYMSKDHLSKHS